MTSEPEVLEHDLKKAGTAEALNYHNDWNALMPVIRKILNEYPEMDEETQLFLDVSNGLMSADIVATFEAVCAFIEAIEDKPPVYYQGPELKWSVNDVKRIAHTLDIHLTSDIAEDVLNEYFKDNEDLMEYINNGIADELQNHL